MDTGSDRNVENEIEIQLTAKSKSEETAKHKQQKHIVQSTVQQHSPEISRFTKRHKHNLQSEGVADVFAEAVCA